MLSSFGSSGKTPSVGQIPLLILSENIPLNAAGTRTEPPVSVPIAKAHKPAATATAEPELEPPGIRCISGSCGFLGVPRGADTPVMPKQNSTVLVWPRITQPAARKALINLPSVCISNTVLRSTLEPTVGAGKPWILKTSLIEIGTPIRGPKSTPVATS